MYRNDLRKALDESDDNPSTSYTLDTTKSFSKPTTSTSTAISVTTTTTTTTPPPPPPPSPSTSTTSISTSESTTVSTTSIKTYSTRSTTKRSYSLWKNSDDVPKTPKTYFSNSFSSHYNSNNQKNNQLSGQTNTKSPFKIVTKRPSGHDSSSTVPTLLLLSTPTINPFYYGFNRLPKFSSTTQSTTPTTTTILQNQHNNNNNYISTRNSYYNNFTTIKKLDLLASQSTTQATNEVDNNYQSENPRSDASQTEKTPKTSSTYNPVFDIYFKQIARQRTASP